MIPSTMTHKMIFQVDSWLVVDKKLHFLRFHDLELLEQHLYPCYLTWCIWCSHIFNFTRWQSHNAFLSWAPKYWITSNHEYVACKNLLLILISTGVWISVAMHLCICVGHLPWHQHVMINYALDVSQQSLDCSEIEFLWLLHESSQQPDTLTNIWPGVA